MTKLAIEGMTCNHCVMAVTKALQQVTGVTKVVEVNLKTKSATVEGSADVSALVAAVEDAGFDARPQ